MLSPQITLLFRLRRGAAFVAGLLTASGLFAQFVTPTSYTATPAQGQAQGGSYNYFDDGDTQLTDGIYGTDVWYSDLGHGPAYEWVGWIGISPTITFNFQSSVTISALTIGFARHQGAGIYLPGSVTIGNELFAVAGDAVSDFNRADLTFTLAQPVVGNQLTVSIYNNVGAWVFVDEMQLAATVPEPSTVALLAIGATLLALRLPRRRAA